MSRIHIFLALFSAYFQDIYGSMSVDIKDLQDFNDYNYKTIGQESKNYKEPISCYECNTIHDGESCWNLGKNNSNMQDVTHRQRTCPAEQPYCKVSFDQSYKLWQKSI